MEIDELASLVPLSQTSPVLSDKHSVLRLVTTFLKLQNFMKDSESTDYCIAENFRGRKCSPSPAAFVLLRGIYFRQYSKGRHILRRKNSLIKFSRRWRNWRKFSPCENFRLCGMSYYSAFLVHDIVHCMFRMRFTSISTWLGFGSVN